MGGARAFRNASSWFAPDSLDFQRLNQGVEKTTQENTDNEFGTYATRFSTTQPLVRNNILVHRVWTRWSFLTRVNTDNDSEANVTISRGIRTWSKMCAWFTESQQRTSRSEIHVKIRVVAGPRSGILRHIQAPY